MATGLDFAVAACQYGMGVALNGHRLMCDASRQLNTLRIAADTDLVALMLKASCGLEQMPVPDLLRTTPGAYLRDYSQWQTDYWNDLCKAAQCDFRIMYSSLPGAGQASTPAEADGAWDTRPPRTGRRVTNGSGLREPVRRARRGARHDLARAAADQHTLDAGQFPAPSQD